MNHAMNSSRLNAVKVRLSDSAVLAGAVSLFYALALTVCPRTFPEFLVRVFAWGHFFPTLTVLLVVANEILLVFISKRRAQKLGLFTPVCLALLTMAVVLDFRFLVYAADAQAQLSHLFLHASSGVRNGISSEQLLVYSHLAVVSGIFLPYLLMRVTQNYVSDANSTDQAAKVRAAVGAR
jgi:hypothetical protein